MDKSRTDCGIEILTKNFYKHKTGKKFNKDLVQAILLSGVAKNGASMYKTIASLEEGPGPEGQYRVGIRILVQRPDMHIKEGFFLRGGFNFSINQFLEFYESLGIFYSLLHGEVPKDDLNIKIKKAKKIQKKMRKHGITDRTIGTLNERESIVCWRYLEKGWKVLRSGWPDFLFYKTKRGMYQFKAVEVKDGNIDKKHTVHNLGLTKDQARMRRILGMVVPFEVERVNLPDTNESKPKIYRKNKKKKGFSSPSPPPPLYPPSPSSPSFLKKKRRELKKRVEKKLEMIKENVEGKRGVGCKVSQSCMKETARVARRGSRHITLP